MVLAIVFVYLVLFFVTSFASSDTTRTEARQYFDEELIQRGLRYAHERRLLGWAQTGLQLVFLLSVIVTGFARRWTDWCARWMGGRWYLGLLLVGVSVYLAEQLLALPLRLVRLEQARAWGMTQRGTLDWLLDHAKSLGVVLVVGTMVLSGLYLLIRWLPRWWWLPAGVAGALFGIFCAFVMPLVIDPLFNTFTPLTDQTLQERFRALAARAGVSVEEVLVMDASRQSKHSNAYFTGFGSTRRIVVYDTLLQPYAAASASSVARIVATAPASPSTVAVVYHEHGQAADEIESILAHEIGHWQHDHVVKGIALATVGALIGLFVLSCILRWCVNRAPFRLRHPADPAGLPLLLLLLLLGSWISMPIQNGISRHFERQADAAGLDLAGRADAFIGAEKRLCRDNLSNVAPTPFNVWMFSTHPSALERIKNTQEWKANRLRLCVGTER